MVSHLPCNSKMRTVEIQVLKGHIIHVVIQLYYSIAVILTHWREIWRALDSKLARQTCWIGEFEVQERNHKSLWKVESGWGHLKSTTVLHTHRSTHSYTSTLRRSPDVNFSPPYPCDHTLKYTHTHMKILTNTKEWCVSEERMGISMSNHIKAVEGLWLDQKREEELGAGRTEDAGGEGRRTETALDMDLCGIY